MSAATYNILNCQQLKDFFDTGAPHEIFAAAMGIEVHEINYDGEGWNGFVAGIGASYEKFVPVEQRH